MKLTRKQEQALIDYAFQHVLNNLTGLAGNTKRGPYKKRTAWNKGLKGGTKQKWTAERRKKFSETMKKKWANKDK